VIPLLQGKLVFFSSNVKVLVVSLDDCVLVILLGELLCELVEELSRLKLVCVLLSIG
jgi:hypothetical protein